MKYLFIPLWRILVALFILLSFISSIAAYAIVTIWNFKRPSNENEFWWVALPDGYDTLRDLEPDGCPPQGYYKNPWDALLKRVTYGTN